MRERGQQTISRAATVAGFGYWSGRDVQVEFRPAPPESGIVFVRKDRPGKPRIPATIAHRIDALRRTNLHVGSDSVEMVEHVLAALAGMQVDNCEVWVDAAEMPGCDGSSLPFVDAIESAGLIGQDRPPRTVRVESALRFGDTACWIEARAPSGERSQIAYFLDYGPLPSLSCQTLEMELSPEVFRRELAPARTFLLREEAQWLRDQGLGARVTPQDVLVFDEHGPIGNRLRFPDECVRHKILDLVGDLALAGCRCVGTFVAHRSGHRLNARLVESLLAQQSDISGRRLSA